jgi:hypothetical protein
MSKLDYLCEKGPEAPLRSILRCTLYDKAENVDIHFNVAGHGSACCTILVTVWSLPYSMTTRINVRQ